MRRAQRATCETQSAKRKIEDCRMRSAKRKAQSAKCKVQSAKCKVQSAKCKRFSTGHPCAQTRMGPNIRTLNHPSTQCPVPSAQRPNIQHPASSTGTQCRAPSTRHPDPQHPSEHQSKKISGNNLLSGVPATAAYFEKSVTPSSSSTSSTMNVLPVVSRATRVSTA